MSHPWAPAEPSQHDYERLRSAVMATGRLPDDLVAARFARRGLAGLIAWPDAEPVFWAELTGAKRAAWTPYGDPRVGVLAAIYRVLVNNAEHGESSLHDGAMASGGRR